MKSERFFQLILFLGLALTAACTKTIPDKPFPARKLKRLVDPKDYDLSCIQSASTPITNKWIKWVGGLNDKVVERSAMEVSLEEEAELGKDLRRTIGSYLGPVEPDHPQTAALMNMLKTLLRARRNPSGLQYCVSVVRSDAVNACTAGGEIFFTTKLLEQAASMDEVAFVMGHEIAHNELGHLRNTLKAEKMRVALLGQDLGDFVFDAAGIVNTAFNQPNEAEADMMGIDMALVAGFDPCAGIGFFERLTAKDGFMNDLDNFFRTHPYSSSRLDCYRNHLSKFHHKQCN